VSSCKKMISLVLPFTENERKFLDLLLDDGTVDPSLLTTDQKLWNNIAAQPGLKWKAINVKQFNSKRT
jgi:hypothetical protein